jgi:hypothetical protein
MRSVNYAECCKQAHYGECYYAECCYAELRYTECRYAECRYAECRGALQSIPTFVRVGSDKEMLR